MVDFKLPDLGEGITEAEIISWDVKEGDVVLEHQPIAQVETDKAIVPVPAPVAGTVRRIHHAVGDTVRVGEVLVSFQTDGTETASAASPAHAAAKAAVSGNGGRAAATNAGTSKSETEKPETRKPDDDAGSVVGRLAADDGNRSAGEVLATPAVRRLARRYAVALETVSGTGLGGRITEADVRRLAEQSGKSSPAPAAEPGKSARPAGGTGGQGSLTQAASGTQTAGGTVIERNEFGEVEKRPMRGVRRAISRHLSHAARVVVPVTVTEEADATELARIRSQEGPAAKAVGVKLTLMPFLIKAAVQALKQYPMLNSVLDERHEEIHLKRYYNIGIAVDTAEGLMVPVIRDADKAPMLEIAARIERLAAAAHSRSLKLEELRGGTFTITNMGAIGGIFATPIVNYPEVAILALGRMRDRVVIKDGQTAVRKILPLSLTFDHRLIDGGDGTRFLNAVIAHIEDPNLLLIKG